MSSNNRKNLKEIPSSSEIWQILKEVAKRQEEVAKRQEEAAKHQEESNRAFNERLEKSRKEFDRSLKESRIEFDKKMNKMRGIWSNAWGDFVESLVSGSLVKMLQEWIPSINVIMKNIEGYRRGCEIDILAVNNEALVATEVKSTLDVMDVKDFLEKLKKFTVFFPYFKGYKLYGAVAYLKVNQDAEKFAMKQGLFVIRGYWR